MAVRKRAKKKAPALPSLIGKGVGGVGSRAGKLPKKRKAPAPQVLEARETVHTERERARELGSLPSLRVKVWA